MPIPDTTETTSAGIPLREQRGDHGIQHFDAIVAALPPALRAAFESERATQQAAYDTYVRAEGYHT